MPDSVEHTNVHNLLSRAWTRSMSAAAKFGPHPSAEFACCRIAEETGELIQAATAVSKGRGKDRADRVYDEAIDVIAMVIRLVQEFPDGLVGDPHEQERDENDNPI